MQVEKYQKNQTKYQFFSYGEADNIHTLNDFNFLKSKDYITNYHKDLQTLFEINNVEYKL